MFLISCFQLATNMFQELIKSWLQVGITILGTLHLRTPNLRKVEKKKTFRIKMKSCHLQLSLGAIHKFISSKIADYFR